MKTYKILFNAIVIIVILAAIFFFGFSDSYKLSMEAKMKYMMGEYAQARTIAKEAFDLDPYNRMAISILAQSRISAEMADYVQDAKGYLQKIERLTKKPTFSNKDKIKIKMMCEVMMARYHKLNPTVMTDKELFASCTQYNEHFEKIYAELFPEKK